MSITYVLGRSGAGKSTKIISEIQERLKEKNDHRLILLVPEQYTLQGERDLIEKTENEGIIGAQVLSLNRLAYYVFQEVGGGTKEKISDLGKSMALKKVIGEVENKLTIYKRAMNQNGFIDKVKNVIKEFKQYDITPLDLMNCMNKIEDGTLKHKLGDVVLIYKAFNEYLKGKYMDSEDHINLFIESIEKASFLEGAEIWIDSIHYFTPQNLRIIEALMLKAKSVTIAITHDPENTDHNNLFYLSQNTLLEIKKIAKRNNLKEDTIDLNACRKVFNSRDAELKHLEKYFYHFPYKPYMESMNNIHVFAGGNLYSEIENVAAEISSLLRERNFRYKDIAVVSANIQGYKPIIDRVFNEYGIPFDIEEKRDIMTNPTVELVLSAVKIVAKGYLYEDMFRYLKTGLSNVRKNDVEELENYVLKYGIKGTLWFKDFTIEGEINLDELNTIRRMVIAPILELEKKLTKSLSVTEITGALFSFLENLEIKEQLEDSIERLKIKGNYEAAFYKGEIWNSVIEVFNQLSEIMGEVQINLNEYFNLLKSGFMSCEVGITPATLDQVLIGNMERAKNQNIKSLFIVGVNDGILPSAQAEEGLILDHEKKVLQKNGIHLSANSDNKILEERFITYTVLSKPSESIYISYAIADQEGRALRPSMLINQFKKVFPLLSVKSDLLSSQEQQLHLITHDVSTYKYLVENLRKYIDEEPINEIWWDVYQWYFNQSKWRDKIINTVSGLFYENQVYYLESSQAKLLYDKPIKASVSRLETFINCPFAHFIQYGLKPKERKEYQLNTPDIGKIYHEVIDLFARKVKEEDLNWNRISQEQCHNYIDEIIQELASRFENGVLYSTFRYQYLVKRLNRICKRALWTLIEHINMGDFKPWGHEIYFGENGDVPSVEIEVNEKETIFLEGRIDRVDFFEDEKGVYFKIIDYKSGAKDFNLSDVYYGFQLQLMVYLEAMLAGAKTLNQQSKPAGILYFKIDDPMINTIETNPEIIITEINKKLKMKGLVLNNAKIVRCFHRDIEKHSSVIPVALNKDGEISTSSSVATEEEFFLLLQHVKGLAKQMSQEIIRGKIKIEPSKKGKSNACQYCKFKTICQFDQSFKNNKYNIIKEMKNEEVLESLLRKEGEQHA